MTSVMAFSKAAVKYKPLNIRVGFVVRDGHVGDLVAAAGVDSLLWGGVYNPILPISDGDNAFCDQLMSLFSGASSIPLLAHHLSTPS